MEQLIEEHWVLGGATGRLPRGRRPTFLRLNDERVIIGVDIRPDADHGGAGGCQRPFSSQEIDGDAVRPESRDDGLIAIH